MAGWRQAVEVAMTDEDVARGDNIASMTHLLCRRPLQLARLRASGSRSHRSPP
jgi:hypothetical protein